MASLEELRSVRAEKLTLLSDFGMEAFPASVPKTHTLSEVTDAFTSLESSQEPVSVVGRILSLRGQGAIMFATLFDGTEKFQVVFKKDEIDEQLFTLFSDTVDLGDFISVTGTLFTTQKGAQSVLVKSWTMATKALLRSRQNFTD
jgi:lysyl-tRNA synthetase class 2